MSARARFPASRRVAAHAAVTAALSVAMAATLLSQDAPKQKKAKSDSSGTRAPKSPAAVPPLFAGTAPLAVTFTVNLKQLRDDRSETSPYRAVALTVTGEDGKKVTVPARVKTHGIWRLKHCAFPPLRLNVANKEAKGTVFYDLQKPKMVSVCHDRDNYEQMLLKELQLYRILGLLTPVSHRVRALRVTYVDSASGRPETPRYAFLFEDPDELADRLGGRMLKQKGAGPDDIDHAQGAIVYLFQYMIGNTDFSFNGLHNGELVLRPDGSPLLPVPYDFDFSGAVNAPYATVDPKLSVKRVRDRLYRGYCALDAELPAAAALFRAKKDAIYALYADEIGALMTPDDVRDQLRFFDRFFDDIATPDRVREVASACVGPRN